MANAFFETEVITEWSAPLNSDIFSLSRRKSEEKDCHHVTGLLYGNLNVT